MRTGIRDLSALDRLLSLADEGLRVILAGPAARSRAGRPSPALTASPVDLSPDEAAATQAETLARLRRSNDHKAAVEAFREKRDPTFTRS